jgi:hypothetical protein
LRNQLVFSAVARQIETPELTDQELMSRVEELEHGIEDGTIPMWRGDEPLADHLERVRAGRR